jgi:mannitol-specific phosphotransferase system IIBC component
VSFATHGKRLSPILGGLFALGYPTVLVAIALSVGFRRGGDMGEFAATVAATGLFLIAAPTSWVLAFSFIDVTRFTVLVFGVFTSVPIWYVFGVALARRSDGWIEWLRRYAIACVVWTAANLVLFGIIASFSG